MLGSGLTAAARLDQELPVIHWDQRVMLGFGTTLWLRAGHQSESRLRSGLDAAVRAIRQVERQMSLFDVNSAISLLNRAGELRSPHPDLVAVLKLARDVSGRSDGAFDVTVQPLWRAWADAQAQGSLAGEAALEEARLRVDWQALKVNADRIAFGRPGMGVTPNGNRQGLSLIHI